MTKRVTIRGRSYPSQTAAAKALGVTLPTVNMAAKLGTLDYVGLGKEGTRQAMLSNRRAAKPIVLNGVEYESQVEAASALGLPPSYLSGYFKVMERLQ